MAIQFTLELAWSQVSLFEANLDDPFNDWTERHLRQGFTWRPGSVSFKTVDRHGELDVSIDFIDKYQLDPAARRAVVVPFTCWGGVIEISTIAQSELIEVPAGRYGVLFQVGYRNGRQWASFGLLESPFVPVEPAILKSPDDADELQPLLMEAEPAA